jgi:hypothetical protein
LAKPGPNVTVKESGGTTAGIDLNHNYLSPPVSTCRLPNQLAGVEVPKLKLIVSAPFAKLALRPSPHAGARAMLLPTDSVNHSAPSGPVVIP